MALEDDFAQTRVLEDLFEDDFTPLEQSPATGHDSPTSAKHGFPEELPDRSNDSENGAPVSSVRVEDMDWGYAAPRINGADSKVQQTRTESPTNQISSPNRAIEKEDPALRASPDDTEATESTARVIALGKDEPAPETTKRENADENSRSEDAKTNRPAFTGDRLQTGGLSKPRLTEEELNAKMATLKLNNARRVEAHRLAEADEASFHKREKAAGVRQEEEVQARRKMDMERERNRIRKLGSQGGRAWDENKADQFEDDSAGRFRGANGAIPRSRNVPQRQPRLRREPIEAQPRPAAKDFPSLPGNTKIPDFSALADSNSWAEQVAEASRW